VCDSWRWPFFILHFPRIKHLHRAITTYLPLNFVPFCLRVKTDARKNARIKAFMIRDIRLIRGQTDAL
jgi:hypothetical protein